MTRNRNELDQAVSQIEQTLAQLSHRFDGLVRRFNDVENQIIDLKDGLRRVEEALYGNSTVLQAILQRLNSDKA